MKKIFILTVVMGIGMMFLSQDAKAQVANSSNVNTPLTATVGVNLPTAQTQNGTVSVEGGAGATILPSAASTPSFSGVGGVVLGGLDIAFPITPTAPVGVIVIGGGTVSIVFIGDVGSAFIFLSGESASMASLG